ncbi:MAG: phosphatase PAP2 family protein [Dysgonamonadaceae bacterium]|nr:phosphatase PAP2 family protein [Dysgonamonadaceae bacterium]
MRTLLIFFLLFSPYFLRAEEADSEELNFSSTPLIVPGVLLALGVYGTIDKGWDDGIKQQTVELHGKETIDDAIVFLPIASAYALDWCGVRSKHNCRDKTVVTATSAAFLLGTTFALKKTTHVLRPDGSDSHSFPSRHTAIAFAGAELLRQEYGEHSPWYGVAAYGVATCSGLLRIYSNKHWFSDILAGAGIGILSTKAAYWLYPTIKKLYAKDASHDIAFIPYLVPSGYGISLSVRF